MPYSCMYLVFFSDRAPKTVCRQCPEYKGPVGKAVAAVGNVVSKVVGLVTGGKIVFFLEQALVSGVNVLRVISTVCF